MHKRLLFAAILAAAVTSFAGVTRADNAGPRVLVIPFTTLNVPDNMQWVAKAVQEDVVSDFGRAGGFTPLTANTQVVIEDNAAASRIGKQVNAAFVVRGAVQQIDSTVRLTGQVIDTNTGDTVQSGSVTGPVSQLLRLEDELAKQLRGASPLVDADTQSNTQPVTTNSTLTSAAPQTQVIYVPVPSGEPAYAPSYPYDYANYDDYYPGFYSSPIVFFSSGFGFNRGRFGFHDHGHDHNFGDRFTFSSRFGGSTVGGFNAFHSPRTFNGPLVTRPIFSSPAVFNSTPTFNRVGFNTGFGGRTAFGGSGAGFGGHGMGGGWGGHR